MAIGDTALRLEVYLPVLLDWVTAAQLLIFSLRSYSWRVDAVLLAALLLVVGMVAWV